MTHFTEIMELNDHELDAVSAGSHGGSLIDVDVNVMNVLNDLNVEIPINIEVRNIRVNAAVLGRAIQF
jgi:hypothetical protein